jgi:hypothetical protein
MEFAVKAFCPGKAYGMQISAPSHTQAHGDRAASQNNHTAEVNRRLRVIARHAP